MTKLLLGGWLTFVFVSFLNLPFVTSALAITLNPGDFIVADYNEADRTLLPGTGRILKVAPDTGVATIISEGNRLDHPWGVAIDAAGNIIVVDRPIPYPGGTAEIIKVNPVDGAQEVISSGGLFNLPLGIAIDAEGNIIVADQQYQSSGGIIKVDPTTGDQTVIASGGFINGPSDVTIDAAGNIYVTSWATGYPLIIVRVDPASGEQTVISWGNLSAWYSGIVIDTTGNIFVSEIYYYNGIFKVDPDTGAQTILSSGSPFQDPWDLDIDLDGNLVVADGNWWWPGRIIKVDPATGTKTLISSGGLLVDPAGIAVFPPLHSKIPVSIDIKPQSCPNPLNIKSKGVLPAAILGTEDFDVTDIDLASIRLAGVAPIRSSIEDVSTPLLEKQDECDCISEGEDGIDDLTLKFDTQEIVSALGEVADGDELVLTLTGELLDGTPIEGVDCIIILSKGKGKIK